MPRRSRVAVPGAVAVALLLAACAGGGPSGGGPGPSLDGPGADPGVFTPPVAGPDLTTEAGLRTAGFAPLSGDEVRAALAGPVRYRWEAAAGAVGHALVGANGSIRILWATGAANGRLRFTDTGYCNRLVDRPNQPESCYRAYRTQLRQWRVFRVDGRYAGLIDFAAQ